MEKQISFVSSWKGTFLKSVLIDLIYHGWYEVFSD